MPHLLLQLLNYEQQGLSSKNEKQWVSVSRVSVNKATSAHAHTHVNDPWEAINESNHTDRVTSSYNHANKGYMTTSSTSSKYLGRPIVLVQALLGCCTTTSRSGISETKQRQKLIAHVNWNQLQCSWSSASTTRSIQSHRRESDSVGALQISHCRGSSARRRESVWTREVGCDITRAGVEFSIGACNTRPPTDFHTPTHIRASSFQQSCYI